MLNSLDINLFTTLAVRPDGWDDAVCSRPVCEVMFYCSKC